MTCCRDGLYLAFGVRCCPVLSCGGQCSLFLGEVSRGIGGKDERWEYLKPEVGGEWGREGMNHEWEGPAGWLRGDGENHRCTQMDTDLEGSFPQIFADSRRSFGGAGGRAEMGENLKPEVGGEWGREGMNHEWTLMDTNGRGLPAGWAGKGGERGQDRWTIRDDDYGGRYRRRDADALGGRRA